MDLVWDLLSLEEVIFRIVAWLALKHLIGGPINGRLASIRCHLYLSSLSHSYLAPSGHSHIQWIMRCDWNRHYRNLDCRSKLNKHFRWLSLTCEPCVNLISSSQASLEVNTAQRKFTKTIISLHVFPLNLLLSILSLEVTRKPSPANTSTQWK